MLQPGTAVAVRTNLYQTGKYKGFKEIVDQYVVCPPVPIHYDGPEGSYDYATQEEFMKAVHSVSPSDDLSKQGVLEFSMTQEQLQDVYEKFPGLHFDEPPKVVLKCIALDRYTESPYLSGGLLIGELIERHEPIYIQVGEENVCVHIKVRLKRNIEYGLEIEFYIDKIDLKPEDLIKDPSFKGKLTTCSVKLCCLQSYPWYKRYFEEIHNRVGLTNLAVHNGIFCGSGDCLFDDYDSKLFLLYAIILLTDKYRPEVNVSRSGIQKISLEMMCDFALINEKIGTIKYKEEMPPLDPKDIEYGISYTTPTFAYMNLVKKRPDIEKRLVIHTTEGPCGWNALRKKLEQRGEVSICWVYKRNFKENEEFEIFDVYYLRFLSYYSNPMHVYRQLKLACLKQHYDVSMTMEDHSDKIHIREKGKDHRELHDDIFPPALFIYPEMECRYLTREYRGFRHFCNADHKLSKFMLENAESLQQKVPGILKEMVRILQEENGEELISRVNDLLEYLRSMPGQPIQVPVDLFLTMEDLYPESQSDEP